MIEGLLLGIIGNSIYSLIAGLVKEIFSSDYNEELINRIYQSLESATEDFFKKYGSIYQNPNDSFLARDTNIQLILSSVFYGSNISLIEKIDRRGFNDAPDVSIDHLVDFIQILERRMRNDFTLDKIFIEKEHILEAKEANEKINKILEIVSKEKNKEETKNKSPWILTDIATGKELPFKEGQRYTIKFPNTNKYTIMIKDNIMYVELTDSYGRKSYYEIDLEDHAARNNKFPYPLTEYKIVYHNDDLINRMVIPLPNGNTQEILTLKWGRTITANYNSNYELLGLDARGGWSVNHNKKIISPGNTE